MEKQLLYILLVQELNLQKNGYDFETIFFLAIIITEERGFYILNTFKDNGYIVEEEDYCYKITNKKTNKSFTITPFEDVIELETDYNL